MDLEGLELISERECRDLLRQARVGRVAVSRGEIAAVFPVNYLLAGEQVLFFTAEGTKLRAATAGTKVSFEVDHIDPFTETGWSVMVVGAAREVTDPAVIDGAKRAGLRPWAGGDRFHLIGVALEFVSGRRVREAIDRRDRNRSPDQPVAGPHSPVGRMATPPVRVGGDWTLRATAEAMRQAGVSAVLVGSDQAIVTERDLTRALGRGMSHDSRVEAIWVTDLVAVDEDTTVVHAAAEMVHHEIRHLVVRNWRGEVSGVVSLRDLLRVLVDAMDPDVWAFIGQSLSAGDRVGPRSGVTDGNRTRCPDPGSAGGEGAAGPGSSGR